MSRSKTLTEDDLYNWTSSNTFLGTTALAVYGYPVMGGIDLPEPARMAILISFYHEDLDVSTLMHEMRETGEPATEGRLRYILTVMVRGMIFADDADDSDHRKVLDHDLKEFVNAVYEEKKALREDVLRKVVFYDDG